MSVNAQEIESHEWINTPKRAALPWAICDKCGLVALKNESTKLAIKLGCGWKEHPRMIAYMKAKWNALSSL